MAPHDASQRRGLFPPTPRTIPIRQPRLPSSAEIVPHNRLRPGRGVQADAEEARRKLLEELKKDGGVSDGD